MGCSTAVEKGNHQETFPHLDIRSHFGIHPFGTDTFAALTLFFSLLHLFSCLGAWMFAAGLVQLCPVSVEVS